MSVDFMLHTSTTCACYRYVYANSIPQVADITEVGELTVACLLTSCCTPPPPVPAIYANSIPLGADITEVGELTVS